VAITCHSKMTKTQLKILRLVWSGGRVETGGMCPLSGLAAAGPRGVPAGAAMVVSRDGRATPVQRRVLVSLLRQGMLTAELDLSNRGRAYLEGV